VYLPSDEWRRWTVGFSELHVPEADTGHSVVVYLDEAVTIDTSKRRKICGGGS
jgi:hypothetical protein